MPAAQCGGGVACQSKGASAMRFPPRLPPGVSPVCTQGVGWRTCWVQECAASEASARPLRRLQGVAAVRPCADLF